LKIKFNLINTKILNKILDFFLGLISSLEKWTDPVFLVDCLCLSSLVLFQGVVGVDICLLRRLLGLLASLLHVGLDVEISEEKEEESPVEQDDVAEYFGEITLDEERETGVDEESDELSEL